MQDFVQILYNNRRRKNEFDSGMSTRRRTAHGVVKVRSVLYRWKQKGTTDVIIIVLVLVLVVFVTDDLNASLIM